MNLLQRDFIVREPLLVSILVLITILFSALTHSYSQAYDHRRLALGVEWYERGNHELADKHPDAAVADYRTALFYDPQNPTYSLHLAEALTQANHTEQALNYYLSLWQSQPINGLVNLQIARLYARKGENVAAERYFNGAVFGDWSENAADNRRAASLELIHFYLDRGDMGHAESQLILLSGNLPEDPDWHTRVAELYLRVGDAQRAFDQYREALRLNPNYLPALHGAGEAALRMGNFHDAESYLARAVRMDPANPSGKQLLQVVQAVTSLNPYERGIPEAEKIRRTLRAFDVIGNRLESCGGQTPTSSVGGYYTKWKDLKAAANARFLTQHPEEIEALLDFTASAEKIAQSHCGEGKPEDAALLAIAQQREMQER
jgi:Tfp pilus assembly protein PilF